MRQKGYIAGESVPARRRCRKRMKHWSENGGEGMNERCEGEMIHLRAREKT